jgi:hypothetical protein
VLTVPKHVAVGLDDIVAAVQANQVKVIGVALSILLAERHVLDRDCPEQL